MEHFGLDTSFQYSQQQQADYAKAFAMLSGVMDEDADRVHPMQRVAEPATVG